MTHSVLHPTRLQQTRLQQARELELPSREAMLRRAPSVQQFWDSHRQLLSDAWREWEAVEQDDLAILDSGLIDEALRTAVKQAWENPERETDVKALMTEVATDVYQFQLFDVERIADLRNMLEQAWDAGIPLRPPYGIVLNRRGAMLDRRSQGYLAAPSFQAFYQQLLDTYMRTISRLLFPEIIGYDSQSFGFSIHYQPTTDASIRPHTDASSVTLNINMNLPDETFEGSELDVLDAASGDAVRFSFTPGSAMLHRGNVPHAAQPITSGQRSNLVLWLYGERGQIPPQGAQRRAIPARDRWVASSAEQDDFAPF